MEASFEGWKEFMRKHGFGEEELTKENYELMRELFLPKEKRNGMEVLPPQS